MRPMQYVPRIQSMEEAIVTKCEEIKKQRKVVRRLLQQSQRDLRDKGTQMLMVQASAETQVYLSQSNFGQ